MVSFEAILNDFRYENGWLNNLNCETHEHEGV